MELRQLITDHERQTFAKCLEKARATRGFGFREAPRSHLGRAHLMLGDLYALFEDDGQPPEQMVAGFTVHDLATLPQSYPQPDLSHIPPSQVLEGGELWSLSPGVGRVARGVAAAVAGLMQARAIVIYSIVKPADITHFYAEDGFARIGEPVRWPYVVTTEGSEIWIQPMILEGEKLHEYIRSGFEFLFHTAGEGRAFRFDKPFAPKQSPSAVSPPREQTANSSPIPSAKEAGEHNGIASLQTRREEESKSTNGHPD